jgi:hypothetical protein
VFRKLQTRGGKDPPTVHGGPLGYRAAESWCFRELGLGLWSPNGLRSLTELGPELLLVPVTMRWVGPEVAHDKPAPPLAKELMGGGSHHGIPAVLSLCLTPFSHTLNID